MFGRRPNTRPDNGNARDERLSALLHEWHGIEPHPHFEATVWRHIHASTAEPKGRSFVVWVREWILPRPGWAMAMAVAVLVGSVAGIYTPATDRDHHANLLLQPRTLAGSYLALAAGESR